jgi:hypothetical protein
MLAVNMAGCADAQTGDSGTPGKEPRVKVADEIYDFGLVPQRALVSHVFWLKNTGGATLEIQKLVPNCGCTEAPLEKKKAAPGDSIRVEIAFGSGLFHGPVQKFIQIESNAAGRVPALTFSASVVTDSEPTGPVSLNPRTVNLDLQHPDSTANGWNAAVTLRNNSAAPLAISIIRQPDRQVVCDDFSGLIGPGEDKQIALHFEPALPQQIFSKSITFEAAGSDTVRITLPIFKTGPWGAKPAPDAGKHR